MTPFPAGRRLLISISSSRPSSSMTASVTTTMTMTPDEDRRREEDGGGGGGALLRHVAYADDGHPLRLYSRVPRAAARMATAGGDGRERGGCSRKSILLLHGRTWSSRPVYDLRTSEDDVEGLSTLQKFADMGYDAYALDFRGFGETPRDDNHNRRNRGVVELGGGGGGGGGHTTPGRCVDDVASAIEWISERHDVDDDDGRRSRSRSRETTRPALLGWSQGALVAMLYAQRRDARAKMSDLVLYGTIYDPNVVYPRRPLFDASTTSSSSNSAPEVANTEEASLEDFTIPGTITREAALAFSSLAMACDPIKAAWDELHEFNECDPSSVKVPTLVISGAKDPYVNWNAQLELLRGLGTEDKAMYYVPNSDHAAHVLEERDAFVGAVAGFLSRRDGI